MTNEILDLTMLISFGILVLIAAGIIAAVFSAVVMYGFPDSTLAKWLDGVWFDAEETPENIWSPKAGDCISGKKLNGR